MITINAYIMPKNLEDPNYDILSIRYLVSKDPTFLDATKQIANVLKAKADTTFKKLSLAYNFEDNEPVYSKITYNYPNSISEESSVCRCLSDQIGFSFNNNIINTPFISITEYAEHNNIPISGFTIEVSPMKMFMGHGELISTTYQILDTNDKVVFSSPRDTFNLLSITVPADKLEEDKSYRIEVRHHNNYESESYPAVLYFTTSGDYNLIHINENTISFNDNSVSTFTFSHNLSGFKYATMDVLDDKLVPILKNFITKSKEVRLPVINMTAGNRYYIVFRALYTNHSGEEVFSNRITVSRICNISSDTSSYFPSYTYNNIFSVSKYNYTDGFIGDNNLLKGVSKQLKNGDIPIYNIIDANNIEIRFYKYYNSTFSYTGRGFSLHTVNTIDPTEGVNIFLVEDRILIKERLIISFVADVAGVKSTELYSYEYITGIYGNVDITVSPTTMILPFNTLLSNGVPAIDYKDSTFILTSSPKDATDKHTMHSVNKDLSAYTTISNLYSAVAIPGNNISTFPLSGSKILIINSDQSPTTYGVFNKTTNAYSDRGNIPGIMQNLAENLNLNKFYGYTRLDGRVFLLPYTNNPDNFNIYVFDNSLNEFSVLLDHTELDIPGKYLVANRLEVDKIFTIELNNGGCLMLMSGDSLVFGNFTDIWEYK